MRSALRTHTPARVALRSAGRSLATSEILDLNWSLAQARDALHTPLSLATLVPSCIAAKWTPLRTHSAARDRGEYLRRPDLGRRLSADSRDALTALDAKPQPLAIILADGLSPLAIERHAVPLLLALRALVPEIAAAPLVIAEQARVAIGDEIGELLHAQLALLMIGERPGLSSPDSLGAYLTWSPKTGRTDAERNCISNIRPEGLRYPEAAEKIAFYLRAARQLGRTGVDLKEDSLLPSGER
ncbi:ethanolamine ammonia-lyase subunit EutC [Silvibacterium dinghuense]|uniref:Ethanolamine ammonia-lyase small subunit n=2 Tax=Silvibacterium dinghuense TaxID=1560006 RepID=A0A4Q1S940_9BACT|nr:ethanolamine ammonia-lyase subunit EutC [Silvibacterium dinghuense]GGH05551.1 ethanolamine ammonia-lyase light chain [Silvibacterium dinghuense]